MAKMNESSLLLLMFILSFSLLYNLVALSDAAVFEDLISDDSTSGSVDEDIKLLEEGTAELAKLANLIHAKLGTKFFNGEKDEMAANMPKRQMIKRHCWNANDACCMFGICQNKTKSHKGLKLVRAI
ncbi:hypothetical protein HELRODRAFT_177032 [Helobdella robusta]|uniref:Uncharacterized protein n=1 Tax=Helobdella robusta TaxID=6412 RepID=T1FB57_HELRO|nr:hypothetical protein HELRODRAFT_177032 [Helobdella robusta]ESN98552.1 hypothetical protein HELRODRAFT_177032 [Helobdella robusta]